MRSRHPKILLDSDIQTLCDRDILERFKRWIVVDPITLCWIWQGAIDRDGYGRTTAYKNGKKRSITSAQACWVLKNGPIPPGNGILHDCDNRPCSNPDHTYAGTAQQNVDDRVSHGRSFKGSGNPHRKLSATDVRLIRARHVLGGITLAAVSRLYGVRYNIIGKIVRRMHWTEAHYEPSEELISFLRSSLQTSAE